MFKNIHKSVWIGIGVNFLVMLFYINFIYGISCQPHIKYFFISVFIASFIMTFVGVYMIAAEMRNGAYIVFASGMLFLPLGFLYIFGCSLSQDVKYFTKYKEEYNKRALNSKSNSSYDNDILWKDYMKKPFSPSTEFPYTNNEYGGIDIRGTTPEYAFLHKNHHTTYFIISSFSVISGLFFFTIEIHTSMTLIIFGLTILVLAIIPKEPHIELVLYKDYIVYPLGEKGGKCVRIYYKNIISAKIEVDSMVIIMTGKSGKNGKFFLNLAGIEPTCHIEAYTAIEDKMNKFGIPMYVIQ